MKTIAQIAQELGVTKPAVRRYLSENVRKEFSETISGVIYISSQGEELIKSKFLKNRQKSDQTNIFGNISENESERVSDVSVLVSILQKELEIKNKQIEELTATIRIQAESINADRKNELAETIIDGGKLLEESKPKKGGFWGRFRRK